MTAPLEGITDAHLQAAKVAAGSCGAIADVRKNWQGYPHTVALARQIAANEKLAAELAELRAKYEPEVDSVEVRAELLAEKFVRQWFDGDVAAQKAAHPKAFNRVVSLCMEMQPAPFTREEAELIARKLWGNPKATHGSITTTALTTPHAELRAMLGDG